MRSGSAVAGLRGGRVETVATLHSAPTPVCCGSCDGGGSNFMLTQGRECALRDIESRLQATGSPFFCCFYQRP